MLALDRSCLLRSLPLAALALASVTTPSSAQMWELLPAPATAVAIPTSAMYSLDCNGGPVPPCCSEVTVCGPLAGPLGVFTDVLGWDNWWESIALCKDDLGDCGFMKARGEGVVRVRGVGSSSVLIRWDALAYTKERCDNAPGVYFGEGKAAIAAVISFTIVDPSLPAGTPVTVNFRWKQASTNSYSPEAPGDDLPTEVLGGSLTILNDGVPDPQFDLDFDLVAVKAGRFGPDIYGSFGAVVGSTVAIASDVALTSTITNPAEPSPGGWPHRECTTEKDSELVSWGGEIELSLDGPVAPPEGGFEGPPGEPEPTPAMLFSVDIGGDAELADPTSDGNEVFDPGDAYPWMGPVLPLTGADGPIDDDAFIVGPDPTPDPGVPFFIRSCTNVGPPPPYFDLDDLDVLDVSLMTLIPPGGPLPAPIARFGSTMIHRLEHSVMSFDDDGPEGFISSFFAGAPYCSTPVGSNGAGAFGIGTTFGRSATDDEVVQVPWTPGLALPYAVGTPAPGLDESSLHVNLFPNPDFGDDTDDDVDALDILPADAPIGAGFVYFTRDHESPGPVPGAPGVVMQWSPGLGLVPVIVPTVHLGLPATVDIRALEFVWLAEPPMPESLAMIFSVSPDDPLTPLPTDESGGLDPAMLYYSFLTGSYADLTAFPFDAPIDAFSNYRRALLSDPVIPAPPTPCMGDGNADGVVNFADVTSALANFGNTYPGPDGPGDADHNGVVNFADVTAVLANWLGPC